MLSRTAARASRAIGASKGAATKTATRNASSQSSSEQAASSWKNTAILTSSTALGFASVAWYYYQFGRPTQAMTPAEEGLHATQYPWEHEKYVKTFDHAALRRGFQVYREVCASCHSLSRIPYRTLVGNIMTVDEAKALAEENEYDTEPNDEGEIEKRPGKLSDYIPSPYKNDEAGRAANNGALPPDLSLITKARHGGCNYIFSLLTGYPEEPPAGAVVQSGLNFNPYFPGTGIAMARVLYDGLVEYEDGTPATTSQMAKDVVEFLNWSAEPEMDDRKRMGWKVMVIGTTLFVMSVWVKRYKWSTIKTRHISYTPPATPQPKQPGETNKSPLQTLPAEIRNHIFALALAETQPLYVCTDDCPSTWTETPQDTKIFYALPRSKQALRVHYDKYGAREDIGLKAFWLLWLAKLEKRPAVPPLALTCRQFFREAMPVFYAVNEFILSPAYSALCSTALFEASRRLAELAKQTLTVKHVRIHVEDYPNESLPPTEDAGRVHVMYNAVSERLGVSVEGMFEGLCLCGMHDLAAGLRGVEEFVQVFEERFCGQLVGFGRNGSPAPAVQSERQEKKELRQSDIRDYFLRP
ncbi:hypothetical protein PRZ48_008401 [Zasmidium cellare]|uniref:quinol--cytochrome-c reductase n=1 Tax=Zasmidium cellare TaxID=395010 RepID=A0ABR0EFZ9_ZASCE|nr:hypothetical protein PRZ48_008401 [Zasmidium cellare]